MVIIKRLSGAPVYRKVMHNVEKSGAGNVPLFHPGSRLAGRQAWISGYWSHPTGQAARARGRQHGAGTAEGGEAVLGFAECKWTQRLVSLKGTMISRTPEITDSSQIAKSQSPDRMLLPLLDVASNVLHQMMQHCYNIIKPAPFGVHSG